jgi:hypothetical protein
VRKTGEAQRKAGGKAARMKCGNRLSRSAARFRPSSTLFVVFSKNIIFTKDFHAMSANDYTEGCGAHHAHPDFGKRQETALQNTVSTMKILSGTAARIPFLRMGSS